MRRTKPTKKEQDTLIPPHREFGGHMPDPPEDCQKRREFVGTDGTEYINCTFCAHCKQKCQRKKEFNNEWKEYWDRYKKVYNKYSDG